MVYDIKKEQISKEGCFLQDYNIPASVQTEEGMTKYSEKYKKEQHDCSSISFAICAGRSRSRDQPHPNNE